MIEERIEDLPQDQKLSRLVRRFSVLEGRQPRAMVCQSREGTEGEKVMKDSVYLAGLGFDVDVGIPFDDFEKLGMNAIESDADVLFLQGTEESLDSDFESHLYEFLSGKGYTDILIVRQTGDWLPDHLKETLIKWLEETLL